MITTNSISKYISAIFFTGLTFGASAENLKFVGILDPVGMKIYADKASIVKRAHISQINLILILAITGNHPDEKMPFAFECDEKVYQLPDGKKYPITNTFSWENSGRKFSMSGNTITNAFDLACKKSYEFWK